MFVVINLRAPDATGLFESENEARTYLVRELIELGIATDKADAACVIEDDYRVLPLCDPHYERTTDAKLVIGSS
jgi:hypothetical protein